MAGEVHPGFATLELCLSIPKGRLITPEQFRQILLKHGDRRVRPPGNVAARQRGAHRPPVSAAREKLAKRFPKGLHAYASAVRRLLRLAAVLLLVYVGLLVLSALGFKTVPVAFIPALPKYFKRPADRSPAVAHRAWEA